MKRPIRARRAPRKYDEIDSFSDEDVSAMPNSESDAYASSSSSDLSSDDEDLDNLVAPDLREEEP